MRLVVYSDTHRDWTTGGLERFDEVEAATEQVFQHAVDTDTDVALFLGDLCDPDVDSPLCHRAIAAEVELGLRFKHAGIRYFAVVGNHDVIEDGRGSHTMMALEKAGLEVYSEPDHLIVDGVGFVFLPYTSLFRRYDPAAFVAGLVGAGCWTRDRVEGPRHFIVAGHMTRIRGVGHGSETHDMPRGRDMEFPVDEALQLGDNVCLLNGHFHERHMDGMKQPVLIPGSLARLTHGEERNTPGFLSLVV